MPKHDYASVPTELADLSPFNNSNYGPRHLLSPSISTSLTRYSSEDDSDEDIDLSEKQSDDHEALHLGRQESRLRRWLRRHPSLSPLAALLTVLVCLIIFLVLHASFATRNTFQHGKQPISLEHAMNGSLSFNKETLQWISDHDYIKKDDVGLIVHEVQKNSTRMLVKTEDIKDERGHPLQFSTFTVSPDGQFLLIATASSSVYRHSTLATYYTHEVSSGTTMQLGVNIQLATWTPEGHGLVWVKNNDIYYKSGPQDLGISRITETGSDVVSNGVPDWVYEEEIFGSGSALWIAPDSSKMVFLTFNDTDVPEYNYPIYSEDSWVPGKETPYPHERRIRYPKPGFTNPLVSIHLHDFSSRNTTTLESVEVLREPLVVDIAWLSLTEVMIKRTDRYSVVLEESVFDLKELKSKTVRQTSYKSLDGGWYEPAQTITPLYPAQGYLDLVLDSGFKHLAWFAHASDSRPKLLTQGKYEVTEVVSVDKEQQRIYFMAAKPSTDRRLFWVPLPSSTADKSFEASEPTEVFPAASYLDVSSSPGGHYLLVMELSRTTPTQRLLSSSDLDKVYLEERNDRLATVQKGLQLAKYELKTLNLSDTSPTVLEILPPNFDPRGHTRYPVLFRVYGGPGSVTVTSGYQRESWHDYLASTHNYVVVMVDGRGTGLRGRKYRTPVQGQLGKVEVEDQLAVAKYYASQSWVDEKRMGIWGWSFGGYLTSKVIEANSGLYSLGLAVAPVTNWEFYDSIYTERYMGNVRENAHGYAQSAVSKMDGFKNASFYLAAGTGDDNVHFLHSATLLDYFTREEVHDFRFRMFTDSAHSMSVRGARKQLYDDMTRWIVDKWGPTKPKEDN